MAEPRQDLAGTMQDRAGVAVFGKTKDSTLQDRAMIWHDCGAHCPNKIKGTKNSNHAMVIWNTTQTKQM